MNPLGMGRIVFIVAWALVLLFPGQAVGQDGHETDPAASLVAALSAACRADEAHFENYLTADNTAAFRALPADQRASVLKRLSFADEAAKPLLSSDDHNRTVLRCEAVEGTAELRFGDVRMHENLAFIPVSVVNGENTEFGLVRENGGWRLLSLGLVLLDVSQLSKQWAEADLQAREDAAVSNLRGLDDAIQRYRRAFGKLPDSLAQLGPAPKNEVSPDQADLVSNNLAAGSSGGYRFRYRVVNGVREDEPSFELIAQPEQYGKTGRRSFFVDAAGNVYGADKHGDQATAADPVLR